MTTTENYTGSDCTGSDGATSRTLTLANTALSANEAVYLDGQRLSETTSYTIVHNDASSVITFVTNVFNSQSIVVDYEDSQSTAAATYTTAAKVAAFLHVSAFDGSSRPTSTEVLDMIARAQRRIDERTEHAWRVRTITDEYHDVDSAFIWGTGLPFDLQHRSIKTLASGSGDKLEIWNGNSWVDWLDSSNNKTEGRANDFWVDYTNGIVYINQTFWSQQIKPFRITYRYGETTVPEDIEEAATKLVAMDIISNNDKFALLPDGGNIGKLPFAQKIQEWKDDIDRILSRRREWKILA